ncbi:MAG: DUF4810 domain-containing protein [Desulfovibrionaceae bacterium]|nr:DUF4810 domain-containing protein [Desulfovibrionaceae bacterium]
MQTLTKIRPLWAAMAASCALAGCATTQPLYQWGSYQSQVHNYFQGEAPEGQIEALERDLQKIKASGSAIPPGYHAQLGLLYLHAGKDDQMVQQFQTEKALFPESAPYMDFLLKSAKKEGAQQ